jgi:hypothetical protein
MKEKQSSLKKSRSPRSVAQPQPHPHPPTCGRGRWLQRVPRRRAEVEEVAKKERREAQKAAEKERREAQKRAAAGASTAREATGASTARTAAGIERGGLPWRSTRLPYLAGSSPHGWIERRRGVDPQEATRSRSARRRSRPPRRQGWAPPPGGRSREVIGVSPCSDRGRILSPSSE